MQLLYSTLIKELHSYAKDRQYQRAVIGLSGGLDSAVVLCTAVRAFGPQNVTALIIPEIGLTENDDIDHAKALATHFNVQNHYQPLNNFLVDYSFVTWNKTETATQNIKARSRNLLIRHYADSHNALFLGTANKSDLFLGYGTLEGEFAGDIHPLGDLFKSEVMVLGREIGLPEELLEKAPSRGLRPKQTDEDDLSAPWSKIDDILRELLAGADPESLIQKGMDSLSVHKITRLLQQNVGKFDHLNIIRVGQLADSMKKARQAEASSL